MPYSQETWISEKLREPNSPIAEVDLPLSVFNELLKTKTDFKAVIQPQC